MKAPDARTPDGNRANAGVAQSVSHHDATTDLAAIRAEVERHDRVFAELRARASRAGYEMLIISAADGTGSTFTLARWGRTRECTTLDEIEAVLSQIGAR